MVKCRPVYMVSTCTYSSTESLEGVHRFLAVKVKIELPKTSEGDAWSAHYLARYLLMSSDRAAAFDGIGSNVDGRCAVSSR